MSTKQSGQSGFTLIEAIVAILILMVGLAAVTNLFLVGGTSNQSANHMSATTAEAQETLEALKAIPFTQLVSGGSLGADQGTVVPCTPDCIGAPDTCPDTCVTPGNYNYYRDVPGVGMIQTRWTIVDPAPAAGGAPLCYIVVQSQSLAPMIGGARSTAQFTTFRTCTTQGCPLACP